MAVLFDVLTLELVALAWIHNVDPHRVGDRLFVMQTMSKLWT